MQGRGPRAGAVALMAMWIAGSCWRVPSAQAEEGSAAADSTASADALIQKGIDLRKAGQDRQALAEFERAFSLYGSVRALAQMALAEQALGFWRDAHEHLQQALLSTDDPWIAEHRVTLEAAAGEIASQLGSLEISCNVPGAEVRLNGVVLGLTPLGSPVPLVAGANVIVVSKPGFFEIARQVNIDAGRLSRLDVVLTSSPTASAVPAHRAEPPAGAVVAPPAPRAAAPVEPAAAADGSARDVFFYTALGLTALGLSAGITGYVMREVNVKQYNDDRRCDRFPGIRRSNECPEQAAAYQRGEILAIGGFAGAAVFGLTATYLWLRRPDAAAQVSFGCAPAFAVLACGGAF